jgi:dTDP-4-amino-4,6-dideoxygalactose transaminase
MPDPDNRIAQENTPRKIPFSKVVCDGDELQMVSEVLASGWLTTGPKTALFEELFAHTVEARHALAVNSCTAALHLGLEAVGVTAGDKVLVPTMTFSASAEVVRYLGADPVFLDVECGTALVTPEILREAIQTHPEAKAFIPVHFAGQPVRMLSEDGTGILDLCRSNGIRVVEDAAHAFPAKASGRMVGSIGDITCFSFYANKTITTGEGGMITTDDDGIAKHIKIMRLHGIDRDVWNRYSKLGSSWEYDIVAAGYKYNMPDVNAAIGLAQLKRAENLREQRQRCAQYYFDRLSGIDCLDLPLIQVPMEDHAWHLFVVVVNEKARISRNDFIDHLTEKGVGTSVHFKPLHRMTYYRDRYGLRPEAFPEAERMWRGNVSLPLYPSMTDEELDYVCTAILEILQ